MLLSICVETELPEERTEDHGTFTSQLRRSDRGGFPYRHVFRVCCMSRVLPEPSRTGWSIRPWRTGLGQASRTGGSV
ncbi:hypothetical protein LXL04_028348 [Taraxacum kok-saghyz]